MNMSISKLVVNDFLRKNFQSLKLMYYCFMHSFGRIP